MKTKDLPKSALKLQKKSKKTNEYFLYRCHGFLIGFIRFVRNLSFLGKEQSLLFPSTNKILMRNRRKQTAIKTLTQKKQNYYFCLGLTER